MFMKKMLLMSAMLATTLGLSSCVEGYHSEYAGGSYYSAPAPALYPPPELTGYNSDYNKPAKRINGNHFYSKNERRGPQAGVAGPTAGSGYHSNGAQAADGGYHSSQEADNGYYSNEKPKHKKRGYFSKLEKSVKGYFSSQSADKDHDRKPNGGGYGSTGGYGSSGGYHSQG
jgi:hypothetical protein